MALCRQPPILLPACFLCFFPVFKLLRSSCTRSGPSTLDRSHNPSSSLPRLSPPSHRHSRLPPQQPSLGINQTKKHKRQQKALQSLTILSDEPTSEYLVLLRSPWQFPPFITVAPQRTPYLEQITTVSEPTPSAAAFESRTLKDGGTAPNKNGRPPTSHFSPAESWFQRQIGRISSIQHFRLQIPSL